MYTSKGKISCDQSLPWNTLIPWQSLNLRLYSSHRLSLKNTLNNKIKLPKKSIVCFYIIAKITKTDKSEYSIQKFLQRLFLKSLEKQGIINNIQDNGPPLKGYIGKKDSNMETAYILLHWVKYIQIWISLLFQICIGFPVLFHAQSISCNKNLCILVF